MGVAGSGKSSIGQAVADQVAATYEDGDDLHPAANIEKMSRVEALNDADREPWLELIGHRLAASDRPLMIGCSALKRKYRDQIRRTAGGRVIFVHLEGARDVIESRMSLREGHFMPVSLLDSQFGDLENLEVDEPGFSVDIAHDFNFVVADAVSKLNGEQND